ncbi:unnamed protein product [Prorocentrum cordatum]|uniref:Uncharacterized protein n=1 Tax=Prorocentrum cordatum TaxID=2364126 RepID=A0ABN9SPY5_9DINO|nr:unnamed protein product [Polarella glacialis]
MDVRAMARRCTRRCTLPIRLARQADRFTQDMDDITTGVGPCADVAFPEGRRTAEAETFGSPRGAPGSALGPRAAPQGAALGALSARQGGVARRRSEEKSAQTSESVCLRRLLFLGSPRAWAHVCTDVLALPPGGARGPWGPAPPGEGAGARDLRDAPAAGLPRAPRPRRLPSHRAAAAGRRGQTCDGTGLVTKAFGCQAAGTRLLAPRSGEPRSGPARSGDRSGACRRLFRCGQGPLLSAVAAAAPAASYFLRAVGVLGIARTCALLLREGHRGASLIV